MFKNYIKIAWRNLLKNKGFSLINITGLALGIGCFIVISMYVVDELSYDDFHENAENIYRINSDIRFGGVEQRTAYSSDPMAPTLKNDFPEVLEYVRLYSSEGSRLVKNNNEFISEDRITYADSTLFNVFSFPIILGDSDTALDEPNSVVINQSTAKKYFGSAENAIGKSIEIKDNPITNYKVTAIIEDIPKNSHFHFDFFLSMDNVDYDWGVYLSHNFHSYVLLKEGTDYKAFNKVKMRMVMDKYILPELQQYVDIESWKQFEKTGNLLDYSLTPLTEIHLRSNQSGEIEPGGNIQYVYIFSAIAIFILIIACINFMNLTTARSAVRAKEVGIRKVLGTQRRNLIQQFLSESVLIAILATIAGLVFVACSLGWFNTISGKEMDISILLQPKYLIFIAVLPFVVGALAGFYPAIYLSSFKPVKILKGSKTGGRNKDYFRNVLVVFQFSTSIALIIGTIIIYSQLKHIQNSDVGFDKEQVLIVDNDGIDRQSRLSLKNEVAKLTEVKAASFGGFVPVSGSSRSDTTFFTDATISETNGFSIQNWRIDYDYIPTLGMEVIKGRNFDRSMGTDSLSIIINESAVSAAGFKDPIGKKLYTGIANGDLLGLTIVGVVKDFNYESLKNNVQPLGMRLGHNSWVSLFRFKTDNVSALVNTIEKKYKQSASGVPFSYRFMDDSFNTMYKQEQRVGRVSLTFTILAVIIACLGLFGLATYIARQRQKEIGIRKVLGAKVLNIVTMLSVDFVKLVAIAFLIAAPLAWWGMNRWLEDFAFKVEINWMVFAATGVIAVLIAIITLSFQAVRATLANPVKSIRTE